MAAFDAPEGPLKGSGKLAVHVLTCTMRPRAFRSAGRNAFMTDRAPNTLTSNSLRMALSGSSSIGPGEDACVADQEIKTAVAECIRHAPSPGFHGRLPGDVANRKTDAAARGVLQIAHLPEDMAVPKTI